MSMVLWLTPIHYYSFAMNNISLPNNTLVKPHELEVARILASHGEIVKFIPVSNIKTPDIIYRGLKWEIKSPTGSKRRTIENNLRKAITQSENIIFDLRRINISEDTCVREIKKQVHLSGKQIRRLLIITKSGKIRKIK